jgi:DNA-binding transcriptional LysR family regulator
MPYPYELKDISCFVQLARAGSMTRAANMYNIPKATLSHHLRRLEDALKVELFTRRAKGLELTEAGKEYLDYCARIFDSCEAAASAAQRAHSSISGKVRIAASTEFGTTIIGAAAYYIATANPHLDFELHMYTNEKLISGQIDFDCLIFVGEAPDSSYLRRKMGQASSGLYASPSFIARHGRPTAPDEIKGLDGVIYHRNGVPEQWQLQDGVESVGVECYPRFNVNEYWMAKYFAVEGAAIGYLPDFFVHYEVELGALQPLLPQMRSQPSPIYLIYPSYRHRNPRIMNMIDALCDNFEKFIRHPGYSLIKRDFPGETVDAPIGLEASPGQPPRRPAGK